LDSMRLVFKATIPMAALMFLLTFRLQHVRLNVKAAATEPSTPVRTSVEVKGEITLAEAIEIPLEEDEKTKKNQEVSSMAS